MLVPFHGTQTGNTQSPQTLIAEAKERAKTHRDVVFLQRMNRKNGSSQYKINLPRWIYIAKKLGDFPIVEIIWTEAAGKINGKILLPSSESEGWRSFVERYMSNGWTIDETTAKELAKLIWSQKNKSN
jgi:hypothetical protein